MSARARACASGVERLYLYGQAILLAQRPDPDDAGRRADTGNAETVGVAKVHHRHDDTVGAGGHVQGTGARDFCTRGEDRGATDISPQRQIVGKCGGQRCNQNDREGDRSHGKYPSCQIDVR